MLQNKYLRNFCRWLAVACAFIATLAGAEVTRVEISQRGELLQGRAYGEAGAYEWLTGRAFFTLDPQNEKNDAIVDLKLAPRNAQGLVAFSADITIARPKEPRRANGVVVFDVVNRGRHTILEYLNRGDRAAPVWSEAFVGDDFLFKQGVTLVWLGWQQDLPPLPGYLRMAGPVIEGVSGRVWGEFVSPRRVMDQSLGDRLSIPYPVADLQANDSLLAVSPSRWVPVKPIPREHWSFARAQNGVMVPDARRVQVEDGFVPGALYQFAYRTQNPQIAGLALAGVRELIAWMRYEPGALVRATHAYAFGISQSGRFLRQFLYEGFNADLAGRPVFDAMMIHIAGGARRGFNERFAQPSRTTGSRVFPFTDAEQTDAETGEKGGILMRAQAAKVVPKILYTHSSWEYWGSAASAQHTTLTGGDIEMPATSRVYLFAGTQHVPARWPLKTSPQTQGQLPHNPLDYRPSLRALYVVLDAWVRNNAEPPASRYPRVGERSLVAVSALNTSGLQGINFPQRTQPAFRLDNGEAVPGIPTIVPPKVGKPYTVMVPQLDGDGNEVPGIRMPALAAPLATYAGWNMRAPAIGAPHELVQLIGSLRAFARTREERAPNDARAAVTERYSSREDYLKRVTAEASSLVQQRLLLKEDVAQIVTDAGVMWDHVMRGASDKVTLEPPALPR